MSEIAFSYFVDTSGNFMGAYEDPLHPEIQDTWVKVDIPPESGSAVYINGSWDMSTPIRKDRDRILNTVVDPLVSNPLRWADLTADKQAEWTQYRTDLLNVTQQSGFPHNVTWPTEPT